MDGTFLDSVEGRHARERRPRSTPRPPSGSMFVPCTGRNVAGLPRRAPPSIPCVRYAVCANGAIVAEVAGGRTLREVSIEKDLVLDLYRRAARPARSPSTSSPTPPSTPQRERYPLIDRARAQRRHQGVRPRRADRLRREPRGPARAHRGRVPAERLLPARRGPRRGLRARSTPSPPCRRASSLPCNIEVTDRSAHKGAGLRWLCDHLGVSAAECIAFGDGDNDRTMLEAAGDGVAMANA